jgi:hypothetical protein
VFELTCKKHPTVNKLIERFRVEQQNTDILYDQIQAGDVYLRKKQSILKDEAIIEILSVHKKKKIRSIL